ncbi:MAG: efflux RND transporter periplasmic adaptor subunit [Pirellulales bacterium]
MFSDGVTRPVTVAAQTIEVACQPRRRLTAVHLLTTCVAVLFTAQDALAQPNGLPPANVVTAKAIEREVVTGHTFVGSVMPRRISAIGSAVDGRVVDFKVSLGDRVKKGDELAQLLTNQLEIELAGAKAERDNRQAALDEAKIGRSEEIEQSKARLAGRKAARDFAVARLERYKKATNKNVYTQEQVEEIYSTAVQADKAYVEEQIALELLGKGARKEVIQQWEAKLAVQEQVIAAIEDQLEKHTIRAPFDGYIVAEHTESGQWLQRGDLVATVAELDQIDVEIQVLESYIPFVKIGDEVRLEVTSLPAENLVGRVAEIVPQADLRTRNFPVRVRLDNKIVDGQPRIKAGMFARATLAVGRTANAVLVPKDAVVLGGPTPVVFVTAGGGANAQGAKTAKVRSASVQLGAAWEGYIQVTGEVKPGDTVIVQGNERLMPGQSVVVVGEQEPPALKTAARTNAER